MLSEKRFRDKDLFLGFKYNNYNNFFNSEDK